ncbi:MAG: radical SAM protein [Deltaproteobacteria bacterium]|nr:radical SAM protein [Deltaproteobacteria bacterium]MBI3079197.1 radical SAM protein [Deltaproteobacteria bacterium]
MAASVSPAALHSVTLQPTIVYGPVRSRRLGLSLGVNPLPARYKLCSFNCPYCQYPWTRERRPEVALRRGELPGRQAIVAAVERALRRLRRHGPRLNALTLAGNGEPTLHPEFPALMRDLCEVRARWYPRARLAVLSNSSTLGDPQVRAALELADDRLLKLDAGRPELFQKVNLPMPGITLDEIVRNLARTAGVTIQTMFIRGLVDNTQPKAVEAWQDCLMEIRPLAVQVYSLDRTPVAPGIEAVPRADLEAIGLETERRTGVPTGVY